MSSKIAVIGLGYVGLPLAVALARHYEVVGYDINTARIQALKTNEDATGEVSEAELKTSTLRVTDQIQDIQDATLYIVTVPTPITPTHQPDLTPLEKASRALAPLLKRGDIVVYESTVYPGVTEDYCAPLLEAGSGLRSGLDFFLGYSPERINPGDKAHTVSTITKVVAGQNPTVTSQLAALYGTINNGNIFCAANIRTAEAAKVIENTQRDINVAFMNEITRIFHAMGLSVSDVLAAARTKWNFLPFYPGLVGGHCISVDPYYLAYAATHHGITPEVILSGRLVNEEMGPYIGDWVHTRLQAQGGQPEKKRVLVLGVTFKENVPDLRNTKVIHVIEKLKAHGYQVDAHDPYANAHEAQEELGLSLLPSLAGLTPYDAVVLAVVHAPYCALTFEQIGGLVRKGGHLFDLRGVWQFSQQSSAWTPDGTPDWIYVCL